MDIENRQKLLMMILAVICIITMVGIFNFRCSGPQPQSTNMSMPEEITKKEISPPQDMTNQNLDSKPSEKPASSIENQKSGIENRESSIEYPKSSIQFAPFTSQAPFAIWDDLHNEACEEAALIMAKYWISEEKLTKEKAEEEILNSVAWQIKNWGGHYDLPSEKIIELAKEYFKIEKIEVFYQPTLEDIKKEISKGNLVIVPTAGRLLKNPYYRQPGPVYHMLVVRGYDEKWIITNDPGTKRGENFKYTYQNFFDSIHDWPFGPPDFGQNLSKEEKAIEILKGQKAMLVISKS